MNETTTLSMEEIERLARAYAAARRELESVTEDIRETRQKIVREKMPMLKRRIALTAAAKEALHSLIEEAEHLFRRPRTVAVDGIKIGYRKQPGQLVIRDAGRTINLIRKHLPGISDQLVVIKKSLNRAELRKLPAADLARVGVSLESDTDEVVIRAASSDLDKLVDALRAAALRAGLTDADRTRLIAERLDDQGRLIDEKPSRAELIELCDALAAAIRSLLGEAKALQEAHTDPDGGYGSDDDREMVEGAFDEVARYRKILERAGRPR
ncbi:MAG: hypothetical protein F4Z15_09875 [Gammaproteobacteria bacterium]|nr:hypothetical protein [Gammaproteobacteria bacterium]MYJ52786.1 hypothetical protein [Gammaproteobacteria bacterium]